MTVATRTRRAGLGLVIGGLAAAFFSAGEIAAQSAAPAASVSGAKSSLTLDNLWTVRRLSPPSWSPDGTLLAMTLAVPEANATQLVIRTVDGTGAAAEKRYEGTTLVPGAKKAPTITLIDQPWTPDSKRLLYTSGDDIYAFDLARGETEVLVRSGPSSAGYTPQVYFNGPSPTLSPDGSQLAFIRESELWVLDLARGRVEQITGAYRDKWHTMSPVWAPDGEHILVTQQKIDTQRPFLFPDFGKHIIGVNTRLIGTGPVRLGVIDRRSRDTVWIGPADGVAYSLRGGTIVAWAPDGKTIAINRLSLDHTQRDLVLADPATGKTRVSWSEQVEHWISPLAITIAWSPDSSKILLTSERDGWNHLYIADARAETTTPVQITSGKFTVISNQVYDRDESTPSWSADGRTIYFVSSEVHASERHLYAVPAAGGTRTRLSPLAGTDVAVRLSPDQKRIAYLHSDLAHPAEIYLQPLSAAQPTKLTDVATPPSLAGYQWPAAEIVSFPSKADGVPVAGRLIKPRGFSASQKYPAVVFVHGAGYLQSAIRGWNAYDRLAFNYYLADRGYVVLDVDFRGSAGYGRQFMLDVFDRMGDVDLADVLGGVDYLKKSGAVVPERIGIWGHSYGGFMAASALLRAPEVFAAGIASAPVTDWERFYYLAPGYNEEHLGFPWKNPEGTKRASPLTYAKQLKHPMLIVTGEQDTMHLDAVALVNALIDEKKGMAEWIFYPTEAHGFAKAVTLRDYFGRMSAFLDRHLLAGPVAGSR
jgi:dipeptidyl aminopeptidase/acylaminoacyl peptidase